MKTILLGTLLSLSIVLGCTNASAFAEHEVAVSSDAERIAYNVYGAGKTSLIFVHGWSCDSRYWKHQTAVFSQDYQVITVDLAGHGNSSSNRIDYTMLSFAQDMKAVIDKEKIDRAILIGHSMGGGVIAETAQLLPNKIIAIIGIDTFQNVDEKVPQEVLDGMIEPLENDFVNAAQSFVLPMLPKETDKELINWIKEDMSSAPKSVAISAFRNYIGQYITDEAAQVFQSLTVPVVSINARLWPTNPEGNRKHIKNYRLLYIEETGHFPMMEKPEAFNRLLKEALEYIEAESSKDK